MIIIFFSTIGQWASKYIFNEIYDIQYSYFFINKEKTGEIFPKDAEGE